MKETRGHAASFFCFYPGSNETQSICNHPDTRTKPFLFSPFTYSSDLMSSLCLWCSLSLCFFVLFFFWSVSVLFVFDRLACADNVSLFLSLLSLSLIFVANTDANPWNEAVNLPIPRLTSICHAYFLGTSHWSTHHWPSSSWQRFAGMINELSASRKSLPICCDPCLVSTLIATLLLLYSLWYTLGCSSKAL